MTTDPVSTPEPLTELRERLAKGVALVRIHRDINRALNHAAELDRASVFVRLAQYSSWSGPVIDTRTEEASDDE